jgi:hypothetical protein
MLGWALAAILLLPGGSRAQDAPAGEATRRRIFVPRPRGDASLDEDPAPAPVEEGRESVKVLSGDRLTGAVQEIVAGGRLMLTAPHFEGPVRVAADRLDEVVLPGVLTEPGRDVVEMTNGDVWAGKVTAITDATVFLDTRVAGPVEIRRKTAAAVHFGEGGGGAIESRFHLGKMAPFTPGRGTWKVEDRVLKLESQGNFSTLSAPCEQDTATTFVATLESTFHQNLNVNLVLFAADDEHNYGRKSVFCTFSVYNYNLQYCLENNTRHVRNGNFHDDRIQGKTTLRLAYDPETHRAHIWVDERDLGEHEIPVEIEEGGYVMLTSYQPLRIYALQVLKGIVPPVETKRREETERDVMVFQNRDRVSVTDLTLADGTFTGRTSFGGVDTPLERVKSITFSTVEQEQPRRRRHDVQVVTNESEITLEMERLGGEYLVGASDACGEVAVRRGAIRRIRFNLYQ